MSQTTRVFTTCMTVAAIGAVSSFATRAWAVKSGLDGYTGKMGTTCSVCHNGGTTPTVMLTGPQALTAGQMGEYRLRVQTGLAGVGMGGAATDGVTVLPGLNTKQKFTEVAHSKIVAPTNGAVEFTFQVQAPPTNGTISVYAIGNAVNNDNNDSGDGATTAKLDVVISGGVDPPPPPPPGTASGPDAGTGASDAPPSPGSPPSGGGGAPPAAASGATSDGGASPSTKGTGVPGVGNGTDFPETGGVQCAVAQAGTGSLRHSRGGLAALGLAALSLFSLKARLTRRKRRDA